MRQKIREADTRRKTQTKAISDFLRRVTPNTAISNQVTSPSPEPASKQFIAPKIEGKRLHKQRDADACWRSLANFFDFERGSI